MPLRIYIQVYILGEYIYIQYIYSSIYFTKKFIYSEVYTGVTQVR